MKYIPLEEAVHFSANGGLNDAEHSDEGQWAQPDLHLLGTGRRPAPIFPLSLLGAFWADWVETKAKVACAPNDYVAGALLALAGALLANVRWPLAGAAWSEPPLLWIGLVGSPSAGKSPAMDAAFRLIQRIEDRMMDEFKEARSLYDTKHEAAEVAREAWKAELRAAAKEGGSLPLRPEEAISPEEPVRPRVRVADVTVEKLGVLASALPRGLLMERDELSGWFGAFDRYGGAGADRAFALQMFGGGSHSVERKNSPPVSIRHLSIGVVGGIQPDKLSNILDGPDDGLTSRFLWAWPDALRRFKIARELVNDGAAQNAIERLSSLRMGSDTYGNPEPVIVRLSPAAEDILEKFGQEMNVRSNTASGAFAGAIGKARGHALRLATVLEFLFWSGEGGPEPAEVSEQAVKAACRLLDEYFTPMAERVYGDAAIPAQERHAMTLARYLKQEKLREFNARTLRREIGGDLREPDVMTAACGTLLEAGLIRERFSRSGGTPGRPARNYEVNPAVCEGSH